MTNLHTKYLNSRTKLSLCIGRKISGWKSIKHTNELYIQLNKLIEKYWFRIKMAMTLHLKQYLLLYTQCTIVFIILVYRLHSYLLPLIYCSRVLQNLQKMTMNKHITVLNFNKGSQIPDKCRKNAFKIQNYTNTFILDLMKINQFDLNGIWTAMLTKSICSGQNIQLSLTYLFVKRTVVNDKAYLHWLPNFAPNDRRTRVSSECIWALCGSGFEMVNFIKPVRQNSL